LRKKIDFVIAGFQKCGTTTLANMLTQHHEISFARHKEPHYFSKKTISEQNYLDLFDWEKEIIRGEGSTSYSFLDEYPEAAQNLYDHNPELKIIFISRDPVERVRSHFAHRKIRGTLIPDLGKSEILKRHDYIQRSLYMRVLKKYQNYFPMNQILLLSLEQFISKPNLHRWLLQKFLGISKFPEIEMCKYNSSYFNKYPTDKWQKIKKHQLIKYLPNRFRNFIKTAYFSTELQKPIHLDEEVIKTIRAKTNSDYREFIQMVQFIQKKLENEDRDCTT